jgi:hypothetical protein
MGATVLHYGRIRLVQEERELAFPTLPTPIVSFRSVWAEGRHWTPRLGDKTALLLLKRKGEKRVSFERAYRGWRASGAREEHELGEGRAFLRWLQHFDLSIQWQARDIKLHPYFTDPKAPKHDPHDETARGLSFAVAPVNVGDRRVKLYLKDEDVLRLLHLPFGHEHDFLALVTEYVGQRHQWQLWQAPAPPFIDWLTTQGKRPVFAQGQLGFKLPF